MQRDVFCLSEEARYSHRFEPVELQPILSPETARLIHARETLFDLARTYGSPLHIVFPDVLKRNVEAFRTVLRRHEIRHEILYGAKVNKSLGLVRAAVEANIGVDVSSLYEMRDALRAGIDPRRLCATGPAKTRVFHMALVANQALISVDSVEELRDLEAVAREIGPDRPARVLLRYRPHTAAGHRFGMTEDELLLCLDRIAHLPGAFSFEGFHFHLSGYRYESRAETLRELVRFVEAARALGLEPVLIDMGGGMPVRYVEHERYEAYLQTQAPGHYRNGKMPSSFYPYGGPIGADAWMDRFLASPCVGARSIAEYLNRNALTLAIEPGRSLADQTALSVFRIARVKSMASNEAVIFVEGSSFSACETWFGSEFLVDPVHLPARNEANADATPTRSWIAGHSCLDEDILTNRRLRFAQTPRAGDLLVYANTAGYQMDLLENEFHRYPMPRRVCMRDDAAGGMTISPDDRMEKWNDFE
jgi:diaminopimelate decarboxylase